MAATSRGSRSSPLIYKRQRSAKRFIPGAVAHGYSVISLRSKSYAGSLIRTIDCDHEEKATLLKVSNEDMWGKCEAILQQVWDGHKATTQSPQLLVAQPFCHGTGPSVV